MQHLWFFLRSFVLALAIVIGLQVRVGTSTLEEHATMLFQTSSIMAPLQGVTDAAVKVVQKTAKSFSRLLNGTFEKTGGEARERWRNLNIGLERSKPGKESKSEKSAPVED